MSSGLVETAKLDAKPVWALALGGFIPFAVLSLVVFLDAAVDLPFDPQQMFLFWSVIILSFLGGIRWGTALVSDPSDIKAMCLSVVPCIIAWFSLLLDDWVSITILAILYLAHGWWDYRYFKETRWFAKIRLVLTILVVSSHLLVLSAQ
ncbi:MAG: DUF3429 domain-containing protein [Pseudomonadota bacterium]